MHESDLYSQDILNRNAHWISLADTKAGVILVAVPALLTLVGASIMDQARTMVSFLMDGPEIVPSVVATLYVSLVGLTGLAALNTIWEAYRAIVPTVERESSSIGSIYFGDIAKQSLDDFRAAVRSKPESQLTDEYLEQVHTTSAIAAAKFHQVTLSLKSGVCFVALVIVTYIPTLF